jgi:hypothetical protein
MKNTISNMDDLIDSRDVIARIEELQDEMDSFCEDNNISDTERGNADNEKWMEWDNSESADEFRILMALQDEAEGSPDWSYGETLIRDSYFVDYAQELAEDCGMVENDVKWPYTCINWEKAASELQYDYMQVDFDGVDYWIRA